MRIVVFWLCLAGPSAVTLQTAAQAPPRDPARAPSSGTASVRGMVVDEPSGVPIGGARVTIAAAAGISLNPWGAQPFHLETTSGDDGRFELNGLPAGDFIVRAAPGEMRATHLPRIVGQESSSLFPTGPSLTLASGEEEADMRIALPRALAIEGRVLNESGEPMAGVSVSAAPASGGFGRGAARHTDDRGRFRLFGLAPGRYRVCAEPSPDSSSRRMSVPGGDLLQEGHDRSCTPEPVALASGDTPSVLIHARRVGAFTLSGTVTSATGADLTEAWVSVMRLQDDGNIGSVPANWREGRLVARGLLPGDYMIQVSLGAPDDSGRSIVRERAAVPVKIESADVTGLSIVTIPPGTVSGRVERDPRARGPLTAPLVVRARAPLSPVRYVLNAPTEAKVARDGTFQLTGLFGPLVIGLPDAPAGWFVASVRHGDDDITEQPREFRAGDERPLVITLSDRAATLRVRPVDGDGKPRLDAQVLLFPADPRRWGAVSPRTVGYRPDGFVDLKAQKPGEYLVVAVSIADLLGRLLRSETIESLARLGRPVTLVEGARLAMDLPISKPGADR